jgi:hypothetical protein
MMKPPAWAEYEIDRYLASVVHEMRSTDLNR